MTPTQVAELSFTLDSPVSLTGFAESSILGRSGVPLVEIFSAAEQRARTSQGYFRSSVGSRLRHVETTEVDRGGAHALRVVQHDPISSLTVSTVLTRPSGVDVLRIETSVTNESNLPIVITAVSSANVGFGHSESELEQLTLFSAESEWLAENRWIEVALRTALPDINLAFHKQDGRGHHTITSHGAWSSGEHLPMAVMSNQQTGAAVAWQLETSGAWHMDFSQDRDGGALSLLGPTDLEHQFARELAPSETFHAIPVALSVSSDGFEGTIAQLTLYRRWLRRDLHDNELPIVYNDFMNTLMGQPSTEALEPIITTAAELGVEVFCIDAGWFARPELGDWWDTVGEWREAPDRFTQGLSAVIDTIHRLGLRSGLWLEPEVVGVNSDAATSLPEDAFFHRFGHRVREHNRYHLDFRHPAARAHLDDTVDHLVEKYGISYLKLDYNINPGAGTDTRSTTAGDGLLGHTRAFREWLVGVQARHPHLLIENCASGAMRADYSLLSVTHIQSTSDQQDFTLYPPIAASAPAGILPEQSGNWAYPSPTMTDDETAFTLATGLSGRLYLSGFLHELRESQIDMVREAVAFQKRWRHLLPEATPFWPLGLPQWTSQITCLGLRTATHSIVVLWDREGSEQILLPGVCGQIVETFPANADAPWEARVSDAGIVIVPSGTPGARLFILDTTKDAR